MRASRLLSSWEIRVGLKKILKKKKGFCQERPSLPCSVPAATQVLVQSLEVPVRDAQESVQGGTGFGTCSEFAPLYLSLSLPAAILTPNRKPSAGHHVSWFYVNTIKGLKPYIGLYVLRTWSALGKIISLCFSGPQNEKLHEQECPFQFCPEHLEGFAQFILRSCRIGIMGFAVSGKSVERSCSGSISG